MTPPKRGSPRAMRIDDEHLTEVVSTAADLRLQIAATAASIAETEDRIADTLDRLARVRPHDAERLRARAAHARRFAARERAQAAIYRSGPDSIPAYGKRDFGEGAGTGNR